MKSFSVASLSAIALACALMTACETSEENAAPQQVAKPAPAKVAPKPAPTPEEPKLVPIQSLSAKKDSTAKDTAKAAIDTAKAAAPAGSLQPQSEGSYVIQVSIQQSKKKADAVVAKLAEQNIKAYVAEVENPGELEGTFYRVRIGYFPTIPNAQEYGKQVLTGLKYAWWVDNSSNDDVGNPNGDEEEDDSSSEVAAEPVPAAQPAPAAEAAPAPAAAQPAPAAEAAPAPAAAQPAPAAEAAPAPATVQPAPAAEAAPAPAAAQPAPAAPAAPAASDDWE